MELRKEGAMKTFKVFGKGFEATNKRIRIGLYLWLANFLFSLLILTPFYFMLNKGFSRSLLADQLARGVDFLWLGDIIYKYKDSYSVFLGWLIIPGIFFLLLSVFLNGGIIGRVASQEEGISLSNFLADCGKYFFRFFRVFLLSSVVYIVVFGFLFKIISLPLDLWNKNASTEWPLLISSNLKLLLLVLIFSIIRMFFDYVKVRMVVEDSRKSLRATLLNASFIGKRFFKAWFLYLLVGLITFIFGIGYLAVYQPLPKAGFLLFVAFIWQQAYLFSRMWAKIFFFSTEYHFFNFCREKI
jgi:hypothetical protein